MQNISVRILRSFLKSGVTNRTMAINIGGMRIKYKDKTETLLEDDIDVKDPYHQFKIWFDEVLTIPEIIEPNAMCLATASKDGIPSARFVLLKEFSNEGFKFFTNYDSRKGQELGENPHAALTFYWAHLCRSVRIEGRVEKLGTDEADKYFHSRPKKSQIGASVSKQSTVISGRDVLSKMEKELSEKYKDSNCVPRPERWGGFIVVPNAIEFWQGQSDRLHDRIKFRKPKSDEVIDGELVHHGANGWVYERLAP